MTLSQVTWVAAWATAPTAQHRHQSQGWNEWMNMWRSVLHTQHTEHAQTQCSDKYIRYLMYILCVVYVWLSNYGIPRLFILFQWWMVSFLSISSVVLLIIQRSLSHFHFIFVSKSVLLLYPILILLKELKCENLHKHVRCLAIITHQFECEEIYTHMHDDNSIGKCIFCVL